MGLAFESNRDGNYEIYRADPDGNNQINLSNHAKGDHKPIWSAKGSRLLFESKRDGKREIYLVFADGAGLKNLTNDPGNDTDARWNPQFELRSVDPQKQAFHDSWRHQTHQLDAEFPQPLQSRNVDPLLSRWASYCNCAHLQRHRRVDPIH